MMVPKQEAATAGSPEVYHTLGEGRAWKNISVVRLNQEAKKPLRSSGAFAMKSRYHRMTSGACSSGQSVGPPLMVLTGCSLKRKEVTTPKLPPPPRIAQKRSSFSS